MLRSSRIDILEQSNERIAGELVGEPTVLFTLWAEKTTEAGRTNLYASRLVHENETIYTIRWTRGLKQTMFVKDGDLIRPIVSIHEEGFRRLQHIKITMSDAAYETEA